MAEIIDFGAIRGSTALKVQRNTDIYGAKKKLALPGEDAFEAAWRIKNSEKYASGLDTLDEVNQMVTYFLDRGQFRDACWWILGCNTALRPSDVLEFKWKHVIDEDGKLIPYTYKVERKTQKIKTLYFNAAVGEAIMLYRENLTREYDPEEYMFISEGPRVGHVPIDQRRCNREDIIYHIAPQPINERHMAKIVRDAARELGLYREDRRVSAYSARKTVSECFQNAVDGKEVPDWVRNRLATGVEMSRKMLGHSSASTTAKYYSGIERKAAKDVYLWMNLGLEAIEKYKEQN